MNLKASTDEWTRVKRNLEKVDAQLARAKDEEDFQTVGFLCRETLISLAQANYNPKIHKSRDGVIPSSTDVKRMLEAYITTELRGPENEEQRRFAKNAVSLAHNVTHKRSAKRQDAERCIEATKSVVNQIAIQAGEYSSDNHPVEIEAPSGVQVELSQRLIHAEALEHLYSLVVKVSNRDSFTVDRFKLDLKFPDLDRIPLRWIPLIPSDPESESGASLVEVNAQDPAVMISRERYAIRAVYRSEDILFPQDQIDLEEAFGLSYRINTSIYSNMEDIPPISWTLYADNRKPSQGTVQFYELSQF